MDKDLIECVDDIIRLYKEWNANPNNQKLSVEDIIQFIYPLYLQSK